MPSAPHRLSREDYHIFSAGTTSPLGPARVERARVLPGCIHGLDLGPPASTNSATVPIAGLSRLSFLVIDSHVRCLKQKTKELPYLILDTFHTDFSPEFLVIIRLVDAA